MWHSCQSSQKTLPRVIAAIPCFNTGTFIVEVISKAKKYVDQVIIIDCRYHATLGARVEPDIYPGGA